MERIGHKYIDAESNRVVDVWFPRSNRAISRNCLAKKYGVLNDAFVTVPIGDLQAPPATVEDVYLRLHLLSECQVKPNEVNLQGLFSLLNNVAWTSAGPVLPERVEALRELIAEEVHTFSVPSIDKFPRMSDYVIPDGVRIADADRVRLGAHVASGTTVMHEGFINFNAGTLGESMVEGRITPGVIVGNHSDVGAGSSIMGTLSGGGKNVISVGKSCLLGANSGLGISLGDDCVLEAGLYITAGTKVTGPDGTVVKAATLSGKSNLLFRRNSVSGTVEVVPWKGTGVELNAALHAND